MTDVDSLVAGVEVVDADPSITHDLNILRQTLGSALSGPLDIRCGVSTNLVGIKNIERQTGDNYMSIIMMEIIITLGPDREEGGETLYYCMKADSYQLSLCRTQGRKMEKVEIIVARTE